MTMGVVQDDVFSDNASLYALEEWPSIVQLPSNHQLATYPEQEYVFDRTDVRVIFVALYTTVFCGCFFGNLLVILVVTLSRRLRSTTNFFLANLALADLCVGVFCVFQNLSIYLIPSWVFGDFLCKMYQFVHSLSYTTSIFILVVICTERYFAIIHPITCKQILTQSRLRLVIVTVWLTSALYSAPKFIWVQTITNDLGNNETETICISHRKKYNSELFDFVNFCLLYVAPLCIMSVLYTRIAVGLWESSRGLERATNGGASSNNVCSRHHCTRLATTDTAALPLGDRHGCSRVIFTWRNDRDSIAPTPINPTANCRCTQQQLRYHNQHHQLSSATQQQHAATQQPLRPATENVLRARRRVIRMLIAIVLAFAACNLPYHARKLWQNWSTAYDGGSAFSTLLTPLTFLVTYSNSAVNPLLYAFLSRNFRRGMKEMLLCGHRRSALDRQRRLLLKHDSTRCNEGATAVGNRQQQKQRNGASSQPTHSTRLQCSSMGSSADTYTGG